MTLLDVKSLEGDKLNFQLYEAPRHISDSSDRKSWIQRGKPFFDPKISAFWNLYMEPLDNEIGINWSIDLVRNDRMKFIRNPIAICLEKDSLVGGVWIGSTKISDLGEGKIIHLKFSHHSRKYAYPFLQYVEEQFNGLYGGFHCEWGARIPKDDPTNFFKNNGYLVRKTSFGGESFKVI